MYPHLSIEGTGTVTKATHTFDFEGYRYTVTVPVDRAVYEAAKQVKPLISEESGETEAARESAYFRYMVQDPVQAPIISATAKQLRAIAKRRGYDRSRYAELVAKYVQSMPYDFSKLVNVDRQTEFPVVTLVDGKGVCGDKSLLLAGLLAHEGFDTALLLFEPEEHMAVGIKGPGKQYRDCGYLFVESTSQAYLSEVPTTFVSGVALRSDPIVIPVGVGKFQYEKGRDVARIIRVRETAKRAGKDFYRQESRKRLTPAEAAAANRKLDIVYQSQFKLSPVENHQDEMLDRVPALRWIAQNVWWD